MSLEKILQEKPSKIKIGFFVIIFLSIISGFLWAVYHSANLLYEQNFLRIVITYIIFFFNYYYLGTDKNRALGASHIDLSMWERKAFINPTRLRIFINLLILLGTINSWIFLVYFGYKNIWYYPILLYILSMAVVYFFALINIFNPHTFLRSFLPFLAIPVCGILLWVFV